MTLNPFYWTWHTEYGSHESERCGKAEANKKKEKMCYQTRQKGNQLPCPYPYVTKVMFHDIHPDSDTCQPEVLALFPCMSIWTTTTSGSWKTGQEEEVKVKEAKYEKERKKDSLHWLGFFSLWGFNNIVTAIISRAMWFLWSMQGALFEMWFNVVFIHPS